MTPLVLGTLSFAGGSALPLALEITIKGTSLLMLAAIVAFLLRSRSAALRHLVWTCALGALLALPLLLGLPGTWRVPLATPAWLAGLRGPDVTEAVTRGANGFELPRATIPSQRATETARPQVGAAPTGSALTAMDPIEAAATEPTSSVRNETRAAPAVRAPLPLGSVLLLVWGLGFAAVLALFAVGHFLLRRIARHARPMRDHEWRDLAIDSATQLDLTLPFSLLSSPATTLPVTYGLLRPRVLLPADADRWPADRRRAVLLHELAHVKRHDCLTQALAQLACAVFWFHPAVWYAAGRLRVERERACDDQVLAAHTRASDYANHLLDVVRSVRAGSLASLGAVAFARPSQFEGRLLAVLDPRRDRRGVSLRTALPWAVIATAIVVPLALLEPAGVSAGSHRAQGRDLSPEATVASVVATAPATLTLDQKLAWARAEADRSSAGEYWIGYEVDPSPALEGGVIGGTDGFDLSLLEDTPARFTLDDVVRGATSPSWPRSGKQHAGPIAFLLHVPAHGKEGFDAFRLQSVKLPSDLGRRPLFWLGRVDDEQSVAWLRELEDRKTDPEFQRELIEAISFHRRSDLVVPHLEHLLSSEAQEDLRASAAEGLSRHPNPKTLERLIAAAQRDRSNHVRRSAVESIGRFRTPEAIDALLDLARSDETGDAGVRRRAFDAIEDQIGGGDPATPSTPAVPPTAFRPWKGSKAWKSWKMFVETPVAPEPAITPEAAIAPEATPEPEYEPTPERAPNAPAPPDESEASDLEVQRQAVESLGRYPEAVSLQRLRKIARTHPSVEVRVQAVESISRLGTPGAFGVLQEMIWKSPNEEVQNIAIESLARRFPPERALPALVDVAERHPNESARGMAIEGLGRIDSPQAAEMLDKVIHGKWSVEVQRRAIETLGRRGDPHVADLLLDVVQNHPALEVQRMAVESLGRRAGAGVTEKLHEIALKHPALEVERQAVESLGRRAHAEGKLLDLISTHPAVEVQRQAVESLGRLDGPDVMDRLGEIARRHPSSEVRRQAVESMTRRDPEASLPILEQILKSRDRSAGN